MNITTHDNCYNHLVEILNIELGKFTNKNNCIIFDIDGTIIEKNSVFPTLINSIYNFYIYCVRKKLTIFIVTARLGNDFVIKNTLDTLNNLRIKFNKIYFLKPNHYNLYRYKQSCRNQIKKSGFNTLMSIGDNKWDIGKHGGKGVIINNINDNKIMFQICNNNI